MGAQVIQGFVNGKTRVGTAGASGIGRANSIAAPDHSTAPAAENVERGEAACGCC